MRSRARPAAWRRARRAGRTGTSTLRRGARPTGAPINATVNWWLYAHGSLDLTSERREQVSVPAGGWVGEPRVPETVGAGTQLARAAVLTAAVCGPWAALAAVIR